ncbi:MAG: hypothetical protein HQM10_09470 [Candidatus Riflebacteria bacterium]|nr:hypothetical protein [Candidatus Riflebacteria bacterium]
MKKALLLVVIFAVFAVVTGVFAEAPKGEPVEKSGIIEVKKAENGEKYNTVILKAGSELFKLLPVKDKNLLPEIEALAASEITVKGLLLAPDKDHPLAAIKVESFTINQASPSSSLK